MITETREFAKGRPTHGSVDDMERALEDLLRTQQEVLRLSGLGQHREALHQLAVAEYPAKQEAKLSAADDFLAAVRGQVRDELAVAQHTELISLAFATAIFVLTIAIWLVLIWRTRRSQVALDQEMRQRRMAEASVLHLQKMEAVGQMAGSIAHDFNNLLTAIGGCTQLAKRHLLGDHPALPSLSRIEQACQQANRIIQGLLTFSRKIPTMKEPTELGAILADTVALIRTTFPASIELTAEIVSPDGLWTMGDRTQIQQALINLMLNARAAMPDGGRLALRAHGTDQWIHIDVTDTGSGISAEALPHIFEPFFTTRPREQGTGLGLAIVHGIIAEHNGTIEVTSDPGNGTTMHVRLPRIVPPVGSDAPARSASETAPGSGQVVLLAEDHRQVREVLAESMQGDGYRIIQAATAQETLAAFASAGRTIDLLVFNLDLPGGSGLDCIQAIRAAGGMMPAILITGTDTLPPLADADQDFMLLRKPFATEELNRIAARLIELSKAPETSTE